MHIHSKMLKGISIALLLSLYSFTSQASLNIFACEPEWAALAKELGGDKLDIYSATTALQDAHHVQARPSLIAKTRRADLIVCSGAELEVGWLPLLLRKAGNSNVMGSGGQFFAADYVEALEVPGKADRSLGDIHVEGNPHVHTAPENILLIAEALSQKLKELDAENAEFYEMKFAAFKKAWNVAMQRWEQQKSVLDGVEVISHHRFWSYLNHWLGLKLVATLEPVPGVSPSSSHLASLIETSKQENVRFIMRTSFVNEKPAEWLSDKTGLNVIVLPASVDYQSGENLIEWFNGLMSQLTNAAN